jgi:hypothetical protein
MTRATHANKNDSIWMHTAQGLSITFSICSNVDLLQHHNKHKERHHSVAAPLDHQGTPTWQVQPQCGPCPPWRRPCADAAMQRTESVSTWPPWCVQTLHHAQAQCYRSVIAAGTRWNHHSSVLPRAAYATTAAGPSDIQAMVLLQIETSHGADQQALAMLLLEINRPRLLKLKCCQSMVALS